MDGEQAGDIAARGVDVEGDVVVPLGVEREELGGHVVRDAVLDLAAEEHQPLLEQAPVGEVLDHEGVVLVVLALINAPGTRFVRAHGVLAPILR